MNKNSPLPEKVSAMISHLANKERTRGCIIYSDVWKCDMVILNKCPDGDGYHVTDFDGGGDAFIPKENLFDKVIGHPVMIGDAMNYISNNINSQKSNDYHWELRHKWGRASRKNMKEKFDLTKSLNEIFSAKIVPKILTKCNDCDDKSDCFDCRDEVFKEKPVQSLWEFLEEVFPNYLQK